MVDVGSEMSNQRSGERFVWRATRESTAGAYCEFDLYLSAGAAVAAGHRHLAQQEQFTVVTGVLQLHSGGHPRRLEPGQTTIIPAGVNHRWGNAGNQDSHVVVRLTPALHIEDYFESFCAIATAGRAAATGLPRNPLQLAVLLDAHRPEFAMATDRQQRLVSPVLSVLAAAGRRLGFLPTPARTP